MAAGILLSALLKTSAQSTVIQLTSTNYSVGETDGMVAITVELAWADPFNVYLVDYATVDGTATAGADFVAQSGTLRFDFAETNKTLTIPILADGQPEGDETFRLVLSNFTSADAADCYCMLGPASNAVVTILDHEQLVNVDTSFHPQLAGRIRAIVEQPDGRLVIGGDFNEVDGVGRNGLARLNADGSLDPSFDPGAGVDHDFYPQGINFLALQSNGKILIAGFFDTVNGIERTNLARVNPDGTVDGGFDAGSAVVQLDPQSTVLSSQPDSKVLIAGYGIMRLNSDGSVDTAFAPAVTGYVNAVALQPDGKIIIGGYFYCVGAANCTNVARLNADGTVDPDFQADMGDRGVSYMFRQADGKLVIAGQSPSDRFYELCIARLDGDGALDTGFRPAHKVWRLYGVQPDGKILVEVLVGCPADRCYGLLERWNADGSVDPSFLAMYSRSYGAPVLLQNDGNVVVADGYLSPRTGGFPFWPGPLRLFGQQTDRTAIEFGNPTVWNAVFPSEGYAAQLIVKRLGDIRESVSVDYATVDGTATAGVDYSGTTGTLTFAPFEDEKVISIPTYADNCAEGSETFIVALSNPTGGAFLGNNRTQQVMVQDNTPVGFRLCSTRRLPNGHVRLTLNTYPGNSYTLQASTNLLDWVSLETRIVSDCFAAFTDTDAPNFSRRFYRAVSP